MKKTEKRLSLSKETVNHLLSPTQELAAAVGGSCELTPSTAGGSQRVCCGEYTY